MQEEGEEKQIADEQLQNAAFVFGVAQSTRSPPAMISRGGSEDHPFMCASNESVELDAPVSMGGYGGELTHSRAAECQRAALGAQLQRAKREAVAATEIVATLRAAAREWCESEAEAQTLVDAIERDVDAYRNAKRPLVRKLAVAIEHKRLAERALDLAEEASLDGDLTPYDVKRNLVARLAEQARVFANERDALRAETADLRARLADLETMVKSLAAKLEPATDCKTCDVKTCVPLLDDAPVQASVVS